MLLDAPGLQVRRSAHRLWMPFLVMAAIVGVIAAVLPSCLSFVDDIFARCVRINCPRWTSARVQAHEFRTVFRPHCAALRRNKSVAAETLNSLASVRAELRRLFVFGTDRSLSSMLRWG
jgi:hypothetical protein